MFGSFLTWLNDHDSDVFVVCTSNDVSRLPPEFSRAERFDAVFFVDLPTPAEKDAIWRLYRRQYDIGASEKRPNDTDWTGAEIKSACRLGALLDMSLNEAARNVVPVAATAAESIDKLRTWASGRCLSAAQPGIYQKDAPASGQRRRVNRGPSDPSVN
jgi:SpoVK/Ycf46/Vps4 family AAA+-type ATPase